MDMVGRTGINGCTETNPDFERGQPTIGDAGAQRQWQLQRRSGKAYGSIGTNLREQPKSTWGYASVRWWDAVNACERCRGQTC